MDDESLDEEEEADEWRRQDVCLQLNRRRRRRRCCSFFNSAQLRVVCSARPAKSEVPRLKSRPRQSNEQREPTIVMSSPSCRPQRDKQFQLTGRKNCTGSSAFRWPAPAQSSSGRVVAVALFSAPRASLERAPCPPLDESDPGRNLSHSLGPNLNESKQNSCTPTSLAMHFTRKVSGQSASGLNGKRAPI